MSANSSSKLPFFSGDSLTRLAQGAALGLVVTVAIGFSWFGYGAGWYTAGGASKMADQRVSTALVTTYTPVCVQRFKQQADLPAKWAAFKKVESWQRDTFVKDAGLATLAGDTSPNTDVAEACAQALSKIADAQVSAQPSK
jgi:hypothetical protein